VKASRSWPRLVRGNPFLKEKVHDPYRTREKLREVARCPQCGARYANGRWTWPKVAVGAFRRQLCPACRRINDHYPAGELVLAGNFLDDHRDEVLATACNVGESERNEHPLHRIMAIEDEDGDVKISTTDIHLPHRIAHALKDAWGGTMSTHYDLEGYFTRVHWERND
jgi:NMD protein affecting ribosome stability and mRNA decay